MSGYMKVLRTELRRESQAMMADAGLISHQSLLHGDGDEDFSLRRNMPAIESTATAAGGNVIIRLDAKVDNIKDRLEDLSGALICIKVC